MDNLLWWIGWRPKVALIVGGIVGLAVAIAAGSGWGLLAGIPFPVLWFFGTQHINKTWRAYFDRGADVASDSGAKRLDVGKDEAARHLLYYGEGSAVLVTPARAYHFTPLYVGETFLGIYAGPQYDMVKRQGPSEGRTRELYYRQITTVDFERPFFVVKASSGDNIQYQSMDYERAESAVNAVRRRLRQVQA
jgi:hypothetical protein